MRRPGEDEDWPIGVARDLVWISEHTRPGLTIEAAIPLRFAAYATVLIADHDLDGARERDDGVLLGLLGAHAVAQPWWLGYLDTGASDVVFPTAPMVSCYTHWDYVLVQAGPTQALAWRTDRQGLPWHGRLPELVFPGDHTWLVSTMWDDDWRCVGGSRALIDALCGASGLEAREVRPGEDATPHGRTAI